MATPNVRRYKTYRIYGLHENIRSIHWIGRTFVLDALTESDIDALIKSGWPTIKRVFPNPTK
jgi:hypothetical protein